MPSEDVDEDLTLSTVAFTQDDKGTRAALSLAEPQSHGGKKGARKSKAKAADQVFNQDGPGIDE